MKIKYYIIIFLLSSVISESITISATNEVNYYCNDGLYFIDIKVNYSLPFKGYYSFNLLLQTPENLSFKCLIENNNQTIHCISNLYLNNFNLSPLQKMKLQSSFPKVKGFIFNY